MKYLVYKKNIVIENVNYILIIFLSLIIAFIHIYKIADIPYGINVDEMGMGYDAFCLANYGVDRYLKSFPLYLINFSGGQSSLYAYLCAPLVKIFGLSVFVMRTPAIIFSFLTAFFGYKIVELKWNTDKWNKIWFLFFFAISPVFIMIHRIGLDCNLSLGMTTMFLYSLIISFRTGRSKHYFISGVLCGFVLYTYALNYFIMPIFIIGTFIYGVILKKMNVKRIIFFCMPLFFLALPLIGIQVINIFQLNEMHWGIFTLPRLYRYRSEDISVSSFATNLPHIWNSLFLQDGVKFNTIDGYYTMYIVSIPIVLLGILASIKGVIVHLRNKEFDISFFLLLLLLLNVVLGGILSADRPNTYRLNSAFIALAYFWVMGFQTLKKKLTKMLPKIIGKCFSFLLIGVYSIYFISFSNYYFNHYKEDTYLIPLFQHTFEDSLEYLNTEVDEGIAMRTTYIGDLNQTYIYYLGSTMISPYEYNKLEIEDSQHLWDWAASYKNYNFNLPEKIDINGNYIVVDTNQEYQKRLNDYGFESEKKGHYSVFTHPWKSYSNAEMVKYGWNLGVDENLAIYVGRQTEEVEGTKSIVLVGWGYNSTKDILWDDTFIVVGDKTYHPQITERPDVMEAEGIQNILNCGFVYVIPAEELLKFEEITYVSIDAKSKIKSEVIIKIMQ